MTKNTGKQYEFFVANLYQAILYSEPIGQQKNIQVEINKLLTGANGVERQFDIYWEYEIGGFTYKNIIECKDYQSNVSIDRIDGLIGKLRDFPNLRGIIATKTGYQSGAETKAKADGIELLIVRDQNDSDWTDKDGTPLIKEVHINITAISPPVITGINFMSDQQFHAIGLTNEVFIENTDTGEKYSLYDLQSKLVNEHNEEYGKFTKEEIFNGEVSYPGNKTKIKGYKVEYEISHPAETKMILPFYESLVGVIEHLNHDKKTKVFKDGRIIKE